MALGCLHGDDIMIIILVDNHPSIISRHPLLVVFCLLVLLLPLVVLVDLLQFFHDVGTKLVVIDLNANRANNSMLELLC